MSSKIICLVIVFYAAHGATINDTKSDVVGDGKERSGRWYDGSKPKSSVPLGYYADPDSPVYSMDNAEDEGEDDSRNDKGKYNLPTSFADFKPDNTRSTKNYYQKRPSPPKGYYSDDFDYPASWMFPSSDVLSSIKGVDEPQGLLAKLKSEPVLVLLAVAIPFSILLAAVLPSLIAYLMGGNSNVPTITTSATGDGSGAAGKRLSRFDNLSFVASVLDVIENFGARRSNDSGSCLQKTICEVSRSINSTQFKAIQRNVFDVLPTVDDSWLQIFGLKEFKHALNNGNCDIIKCVPRSEVKEKNKNSTDSYVKKELNN
ncbi:hypothetical protein JTE90_015142 [Oedothorax gibbosus]|uniref:Uncharacterized protein n=1 Tax=Oedothorax gibbosus TaxID=931172 RepID=A0AAV6VS52_9ARAC|nr:hypothetical protein JTE90_015142 [Oedothorax gibbosus]